MTWVFEHELGHCQGLVEFVNGTIGEDDFTDAGYGGDVAHRRVVGGEEEGEGEGRNKKRGWGRVC